jgi:hypothetical protein
VKELFVPISFLEIGRCKQTAEFQMLCAANLRGMGRIAGAFSNCYYFLFIGK